LKKINGKLKLLILIIVILSLCIFKQELVRKMPILANAGAVEDDELMVYHARTILDGNWLGQWHYNTLIKNPFFSIFLAACKIVNVSYINSVTLLYSIACIIFMFSIRKKIENKLFWLLMFVMLLFNPIMYSSKVVQRVYRNSLIPSFTLIIIGIYIMMFLSRKDSIKKFLVLSIVEAIFLSAFYYTREDSVWILPFVVFIIFATVISFIIEIFKEKKYKIKEILKYVAKTVFLIIPIITTIIAGNLISLNNEKYYGAKLINTQSKGCFAELMNTINEVKPNVEIKKVNNTREKVERMVNVSPSLATIKPELDEMMDFFEDKDTHEVINGLFGWAFLAAVSNSGYNTFESTNELYTKITEELNDAMDSGKLERQKLMPILGGKILTADDYKEWAKAIIKAIKFVGDYRNVETMDSVESPYGQYLYEYMELFKDITENRVILPEDSIDSDGNEMIELKDQEEYINSIKNNINIMKNMNKIYTVLADIIEILGIISYIIITVWMIVELFKKKYEFVEDWIIESSILGAMFTLIVGIAYTEVTQTRAITALYLSTAYPLYIVFSLICIYSLVKKIISTVKRDKNNI
jgi:hypothetical protein